MIIKPRLFTPGPTAPLPQAQIAEAQSALHHHSRAYSALLREIRAGLRYFFNTRNDVLVLTSSGTGAMEAAVVNTVEPGDDVLVLNAGRFGARWAAICRTFGARVHEVTARAGHPVDVARVKAGLDKLPRCRAVFMQGVETSTGTLQPVREVAALVRKHEALMVVDAITWLGAHDVRPDEWGLDITLGASQKALAMAPGLAFACLSKKALVRVQQCKGPRFYFDLAREHAAQRRLKTTFTPALSLMAGCAAALRWLRDVGRENLVANASGLAAMTRAAAGPLKLRLLSTAPANSVTAVVAPRGIAAQKILQETENRFGATLGIGQDSLLDRVFRVAHLGYCDYVDTMGLIGALEVVLRRLGARVKSGQALAAAQAQFRRHTGDAS